VWFQHIGYGVPESSSTNTSESISDDNASFLGVLTSLGSFPPTCLKCVRLGKPNLGASRPVKIIFGSKEKTSSLLSAYNDLKQSFSYFRTGFHIVRNKTLLQRQQLKTCHAELDRRTESSEKDLSIRFFNGLPKVISVNSKKL